MMSERENELERQKGGISGTITPERDAAQSALVHPQNRSPGAAGQVQTAAHLWQSVFDSTEDGILVKDADIRIVSCNRALQEMVGAKNAEKCIGRYCREVMHGTQEPIPHCPIIRMRSPRKRESLELQRGDQWILITTDPILDETNKLVGAVENVRDIRVEPDPNNMDVFADLLFEKVFYNLIDNALRYGGAGMKTIRFSSSESGTGLVILCEDDGVGITADDKKKLFTRGFGKHTGLGLFLSREILAITGITIVENGTPGKGARFEISVPKDMWRKKDVTA